ncbi:LOW QUALITY PROTEIN: testis-expressed protein 19 [Hipposideros larvatus]
MGALRSLGRPREGGTRPGLGRTEPSQQLKELLQVHPSWPADPCCLGTRFFPAPCPRPRKLPASSLPSSSPLSPHLWARPPAVPGKSCLCCPPTGGRPRGHVSPVSVRHGREGMSYVHASWMDRLQHGDQLRICFSCFKVAFLSLKALLGSEDWEDQHWDPELMHLTEAGPEQGASDPPPGQPALWGPADWGWGTLASAPGESSEEVDLDHDLMPTELGPQDATPLGLGPEDANWTQGLPWRFGGLPDCSHWPGATLTWQGLLKVDLPPGEPMVLELGTAQVGDPAKACLLDLQFISMVDSTDAVYLWRMTPRWARRTPDRAWTLLLEPDEVWAIGLPNAAHGQDLQRWKLSILETSSTGHSAELVLADTALPKRGFTILSYLPWVEKNVGDGDSASRPQSSIKLRVPAPLRPGAAGPGGIPRPQK